MTTTLIFLGTSGSTLTKLRACAGIMIGNEKILDLGFGTVSNLFKLGKNLNEINQVYITHTHSDHIGDFTALIWAMAISERTKSLVVIGSPKTCTTLKSILELQSTPKTGFVRFEINFTTPEKMNVPFQKTIHDPENLAYRLVVDGTRLVYTGDTAKSEKVPEFARGADILIHDSTYLSEQRDLAKLTNHSTAEEAGQVASLAAAKELVLTHISPIYDSGTEAAYLREAKGAFAGRVLQAKDLLRLEI